MVDGLDTFFNGLNGKLIDVAKSVPEHQNKDEEFEFITAPSPNIIEWATNDKYLGLPALYDYNRSYQVIRDFFQLRCPLPCCNGQTPDDIDTWGKNRETLSSENLLVFDANAGEDVCPKCKSTRSELINDGLLKEYNQMHLICGMRCIPLNTRVFTNWGFTRLSTLLPKNPEKDTFYKIWNIQTVGNTGISHISDVYYAGKLPSVKIVLENGMEHIGSPIHPIYCYSNDWKWIKMGELKVGDKVEVRLGYANMMPSRSLAVTSYLCPTTDIPDSIWSCSADDIKRFLRVYFDKYGVFEETSIKLSNISRNNLLDIQQLLLASGVYCSVSDELSIIDEDVYIYYRLIGSEIYHRDINGRKLVYHTSILVKIFSIERGPDIEMGDLHVEKTHSFLANSIMNHNSGKSMTAAIIGTYFEHRLINIGHSVKGGLCSHFDQAPDTLDISFTAATEVQSQDTIWAKFTSLRSNSPWFVRYLKWLKRQEELQPTTPGVRPWRYIELGQEIENGALKLRINSNNSNSSGMAGRTRIDTFIDELSRFENTESAKGSDEAYRVLENSLKTIRSITILKKDKHRSFPWHGCMISISSPISDEDKGMRLLKLAPKIKRMYYGHYATWDFNPYQPKHMFDEDFEKDPAGAMRDFGAMPPTAASPLIDDPARFRKLAIQSDLQATTDFIQYVYMDKTGREYTALKSRESKLCRDGERFIAFDAGESFDQFTGACAHPEWITTSEGRFLTTVYDWVFRILPQTKPRRDVWFDSVLDIIKTISKYYILANIEFDRWQSSYIIQKIRDMGIPASVKGTNVDMFMKFVNDVNYSRVRMLPPASDDYVREPTMMTAPGLAFYELERLSRSTTLNKVYNPEKGKRRGYNSDDAATVVVHVNDMVQRLAGNVNDSNSRTNRLAKEQVGSASWTNSGSIVKPFRSSRGW